MNQLSWIADLERFASLRLLASSHGTDVSTMSRCFRDVEREFGQPLLTRSHSGYKLTPFGREVCERARETLRSFRKLEDLRLKRPERAVAKNLSIGAQGFVNMIFARRVARAASLAKFSLRFLDLSADESLVMANGGNLDLYFHFGDIRLGPKWTRQSVAKMSWGFYADPALPQFSETLELAQLRDWIIVTENFWDGSKIVTFDTVHPSLCPFKVGYVGAETAATALSIAGGAPAMAYVPDVVAAHLAHGLKRVSIRGLPEEAPRELFLSVDGSKVSASFLRAVLKEFREPL